MTPEAQQFAVFQELPLELRLLIWDCVPRPERVLALMPSEQAWYSCNVRSGLQIRKDLDKDDTSKDWDLRYVVQPQRHAIFPLLHVNRESRSYCLAKEFWQPQRYHNVDLPRLTAGLMAEHQGEQESGCIIRFDVPFVNYNTDVFTVLQPWDSTVYVKQARPRLGTALQLAGIIDPFIGLDRSLVKHVGFCEMAWSYEIMTLALDVNNLPSLKTFSFVSMGPDVLHDPPVLSDLHWKDAFPRREMPAVNMQSLPCELRNVLPRAIHGHQFFGSARLESMTGEAPLVRPLSIYTQVVKAWLWHTTRTKWRLEDNEAVVAAFWAFADYVTMDGLAPAHCPLALEGCGEDGHSRDDMVDWEPTFRINHKLLYATHWVESLDELGIFL